MSIVVKIGGALLQDPVKAVAALQRVIQGPTAVVHGGGVQITRMLDQLQVKSHFVDGLRVTDAAALHGVVLALLGEVHTQLVAAMQFANIPAVGLFGCVRATQKPGPYGLVGTNVQADGEALRPLLSLGKVPVIPTLALGSKTLLNVNGDETAAAVALALKASRLVFLTDVAGVQDGQGNVIGRSRGVDDLLGAPFVSGGMIPKLRAVKTALEGGVRMVLVGRTMFEASI